MQGNKTYATAIIAIIGAVTAFLSGQAEVAPTIQLVVTSLLAIFIRNGVQSGADKAEDLSLTYAENRYRRPDTAPIAPRPGDDWSTRPRNSPRNNYVKDEQGRSSKRPRQSSGSSPSPAAK